MPTKEESKLAHATLMTKLAQKAAVDAPKVARKRDLENLASERTLTLKEITDWIALQSLV